MKASSLSSSSLSSSFKFQLLLRSIEKRRRRNRNGKEYAGEEVAHFNFRPSYVVGDACAGGRSIGVGYAPYLEGKRRILECLYFWFFGFISGFGSPSLFLVVAGGRDQPGDVRGAVVLRGGGEREHEVTHLEGWLVLSQIFV